MTEMRNLNVKDNKVIDDKGNLIAEINTQLAANEISSYTRLFALAPETFAMLKAFASDTLAEFEKQYQSAMEFNNQANVPSLGPTPMKIPDFPNSLKDMLTLIAKIEDPE